MFRRFSVSDLNRLQPARICLIKPSALGDVVQTLPLLPVLKRRFPDAQISWVINRELREIWLDGHPARYSNRSRLIDAVDGPIGLDCSGHSDSAGLTWSSICRVCSGPR